MSLPWKARAISFWRSLSPALTAAAGIATPAKAARPRPKAPKFCAMRCRPARASMRLIWSVSRVRETRRRPWKAMSPASGERGEGTHLCFFVGVVEGGGGGGV